MEKKHPINEVIDVTMAKVREMVDVNTVVGDPIYTPEGVTIIPVSRVSVGFGSGGSDFVSKNQPAGKENPFGGGTGAGVTIVPVAFLIVRSDCVRLLPVTPPPGGPVEKVIDLVPELVDRVTNFVEKRKNEKTQGPSTPSAE